MKRILIFFILIFCSINIFANFDENSDYFTPDFSFDDRLSDYERLNPTLVIPYDEDNLPPALLDIRRYEIILFGALPITMIFSQLLVDIGYWVESDFNSEKLPIFGAGQKSNDQQLYSVGVGVFMAFIVATADIIIYQKKQLIKEQERRAKQYKIDTKKKVLDDFSPLESKDIKSDVE